MRNARSEVAAPVAELAELSARAAAADSVASLLGMEGAAARTYFRAFATMIRPEQQLPGLSFAFEGRNRRPPRDAVNCLLSFGYALLVKDLVATCVGVGLDPYLGVYHRPRFGRPALALDLAEEFRPLLADSVALNVINNGEVRPSHFVVRAGGVALTAEGRKAVISAYERRLDVEVTHPVYRYRITYCRVPEVQARVLAAWLLGEVPNYAAFTPDEVRPPRRPSAVPRCLRHSRPSSAANRPPDRQGSRLAPAILSLLVRPRARRVDTSSLEAGRRCRSRRGQRALPRPG